MTLSEKALASLNTIVAVVVAVVFLLLPPVSYGVVAYINLVNQMESEAEIRRQVVNQAISTAPQLWTFQGVRFKELLSPRPYDLDYALLTIFDGQGKIVVEVGKVQAWPTAMRSASLYDAGTVIGRLEVRESTRDIWLHAGWLFVLGAALAFIAFVTLRVIPMRALRRVNENLRARDTQLAFANTLLITAMDGSPDGMLVVDEKGKIASYNRRFVEMWEIPPALAAAGEQEAMLHTVRSHVKDPDAFIARIKHLYAHPEETGEERIHLTDGRIFDRHTQSLYDRERKYLGRIWFYRDMTEREALAEAVRKSEEKFRNLVEATSDFIWETDVEGRYSYASPAARRLLGYEPEEIIGRAPLDFVAPAKAKRFAAHFSTTLAHRRPFSMVENDVLGKDGRVIVVETSGVPVFGAAGAFLGYRGIDRDVTQRKQAQEALQRRDALLHSVTVSATELASAPSLDEAMPRIMKLVAETIQVDRIVIVERPAKPDGLPLYRFGWTRPEASQLVGTTFFAADMRDAPDVMARLAPLRNGQTVSIDAETAMGNVKKGLEGLGAKSILLVPMTVDGKYWGHVGFDNFKAQRRWELFEIEILRTLTDLIGNAIQRECYLKELRDAMQIVQDTPTILYRLSSGPAMAVSYISQNIKLFGYDPEAFTSSPQLLMSIIHPEDMAKVREALTVTLEASTGPGVIDHRLLTSRGAYRWVENRYTPVRDASGRLVEIEGILVDVTDRRAAEEKIAHLARTDSLTGLANRGTFIERLRLAFAASRRGAAPFAVHYIDIDRFKDINDTLGHPIGDLLLKTISDRLRSKTRETDVVARPGGDEFAILQTDLTDGADAGALAAKIRTALAEPLVLEGNRLHVTASIGIAVYTPEIGTPDDMLARADVALYRAKEEGRDQYRFHSDDIDASVREEMAIAEELRLALDRGEFELHYQPQVELTSGRIAGMEALLRWNHPTRGRISPLSFIPIAEKTGTMTAIGKWVIDTACAQMSAWRKAGIAPATIAANVSVVQLKSAGEFVQFVERTLAKWGLVGSDLELDVTESMLAYTTLAHNDALERLQKLGVKIAIDDFGTKFSSLDYLRTYRVSRLKLPKSMVDAASHNGENAAIVRAITSIARELNVEVVAQGVETEAEWSFLTATTPATKVQGYFYSKPVPADRAAELLRRGVIRPGVKVDAAA